jgi:hypothetical protein
MASPKGTLKTGARGLCTLSMVGCGPSLGIHLLSLAGFYSRFIFNFQMVLFVGIFPIGIAALLADKSLLSKFSSFDLMFKPGVKRAAYAALSAKCPIWLRKGSDVLDAYALIVFVLFLIRDFSNMGTKLDELRFFSAGAAVFYAGFAETLTIYANTERPLRLDEIEI